MVWRNTNIFSRPGSRLGGGYSFTAVDFGHGQSRSGIQSIQAFATYKFSPHMSLTGWLGPQYTANKNLVPIFCTRYGCLIEQFHNASWSSAFGGNFSWSGQRNSVRLSFSKSIQNGGILLGVVQLYQVNSLYMRQLTPRWTGNLGVLYGNNTGRSTRFQAQHLNSITGYASLVRQLTPDLSASVSYTYLYQTQQHLYYAVTPKWIDNHFQFTLQYYWGHSLGR